jgi:hypothetical protein
MGKVKFMKVSNSDGGLVSGEIPLFCESTCGDFLGFLLACVCDASRGVLTESEAEAFTDVCVVHLGFRNVAVVEDDLDGTWEETKVASILDGAL